MKGENRDFKIKVSEVNQRHIHVKDVKTGLEVVFESLEDIDLSDFHPVAYRVIDQMLEILEDFESLDLSKLINPIELK
jgi:hypothetical protein